MFALSRPEQSSMGDSASSESARSLPSQVQHLLEATEGPAQEQAWSEFLDYYSRLILYVARQTPGDHDTIMDRYAYVAERLRERDCRRLRTYAADGRGKFTTWLTVVVRRLCLDHNRLKHGRTHADHGKPATPHRLVALVSLDPEMMDRLPDREPSADEELQRKEVLERLDAAVASLSPSDQLLLALRYQDHRSAREIASLLSLPTAFHVYRRLNRVHNLLRQALTASDGADARGDPAAVQYGGEP
jgi:RNA polymerase sigma factor (sigma-70 family)